MPNPWEDTLVLSVINYQFTLLTEKADEPVF